MISPTKKTRRLKTSHSIFEFPALIGLSLEQMARLQEENTDLLVRFQRAVSSAISDMLERHNSDSPERIASAVMKDYIQPELAAIETRLKSKRRSLGKKVSASVALGTVGTTVGLIVAMPLVLAAGLGAAATALPQIHKYFDDKSEIETSDLYFLSKAERIRH
jgi:ABC-type phosphate/phosphonate transport system permease subunit